MRVLIIGSGGREHALADAIAPSPLLSALYVAPGNPGMEALAECVAIDISDHKAIIAFSLWRQRLIWWLSDQRHHFSSRAC